MFLSFPVIPGGVVLFLAGRVQLWKFTLVTWASQSSASCFTELCQNLSFCTNKSHKKREDIWLAIKISCCVCFSTIFCLGLSDTKLKIIKLTGWAKEERTELKISAKLCRFEFWRGFILLYYLHIPFVLRAGKISSVRLCCCSWWVSIS